MSANAGRVSPQDRSPRRGRRPPPMPTSRDPANAEYRCGTRYPGRRPGRRRPPGRAPPRGPRDARGPRDVVGTLALDADGEPRTGRGDRDLVVETQRKPETVEPGAEVGARRGDPCGRRQPGRKRLRHLVCVICDPRRAAQARSSAAATATGSTGTAVTSGIPTSAVSGSLRPLPVTVHTTVEPRLTQPSSTDLQQAGDAGGRRRLDEHPFGGRDQVICRQDLLVGRGQEAAVGLVAAPRPRQVHDAGAPIRIAVAMVSGFFTGSPSTSGAAPAAWVPSIRGQHGRSGRRGGTRCSPSSTR